METNLNCDLGETSIHHSSENDAEILKLINTANIACGYHAGDEETMKKTIKLSKLNGVSIGAHPGFKDKENFGRKRINLTKNEVRKLILEQIIILSKLAELDGLKLTHVKPHGALNNMACESFELSEIIGKTIKEFDKDLIFLVLPVTEMEKAGIKLNLRIACEIFADRNYNDKGYLFSRDEPNALITDPVKASKNVLKMINDKSIYSYSGKRIRCNIDSICIHGDGINALEIIQNLKKNMKKQGIEFKPLNKLNNLI